MLTALKGNIIEALSPDSLGLHPNSFLVLEDGRLAGKGTHARLMESCPVYREIYDSQFRREAAV